jgi:hypothetical protein
MLILNENLIYFSTHFVLGYTHPGEIESLLRIQMSCRRNRFVRFNAAYSSVCVTESVFLVFGFDSVY